MTTWGKRYVPDLPRRVGHGWFGRRARQIPLFKQVSAFVLFVRRIDEYARAITDIENIWFLKVSCYAADDFPGERWILER